MDREVEAQEEEFDQIYFLTRGKCASGIYNTVDARNRGILLLKIPTAERVRCGEYAVSTDRCTTVQDNLLQDPKLWYVYTELKYTELLRCRL